MRPAKRSRQRAGRAKRQSTGQPPGGFCKTVSDRWKMCIRDRYLPAWNSAEMYSEETGPRKQCVRACGCWADRGRRDCERFNRRAGRTGIMIYLDYSANTPVSEDVLRCFCETEWEFFGNPNSTHDAGKAAKKRMDEITVSIAGLMGAAPEEIIYTSCASESNNCLLYTSRCV